MFTHFCSLLLRFSKQLEKGMFSKPISGAQATQISLHDKGGGGAGQTVNKGKKNEETFMLLGNFIRLIIFEIDGEEQLSWKTLNIHKI